MTELVYDMDIIPKIARCDVRRLAILQRIHDDQELSVTIIGKSNKNIVRALYSMCHTFDENKHEPKQFM